MNTMGIDIGTTSLSIILMDGETGKLKDARTVNHASFIAAAAPFHRIQDPERIMDLILQVTEEMILKHGQPACIGLTGQMHGVLYTDASGRAVSPLYTWQDGCGGQPLKDGRSAADILKERAGASAPGYGLTTHYYLQMTGQIPESAAGMTTISDYAAMRLCGLTTPVLYTDMAASWGCFDLEKGAFYKEKLAEAGVDTSLLPAVVKKPEVIGTTPAGVPVMCSLGDNQASVLATVRDVRDTVLLNVGTGSQISVITDAYVPCEGSVEIRPFTEGMYLIAGSGLCGGRAYAMLEKFYRELTGSEKACYDLMRTQAEAFLKDYGPDAAWKVCTTFMGTRDDPEARGSIRGISEENFRPGAFTLGLIRGIIEELAEGYEVCCHLTGRRAGKLVGSGNGIRKNPLMVKMAEDIFGMKMQIPVFEEEAACGAALCALAACGRAGSLDEVREKIHYL